MKQDFEFYLFLVAGARWDKCIGFWNGITHSGCRTTWYLAGRRIGTADPGLPGWSKFTRRFLAGSKIDLARIFQIYLPANTIQLPPASLPHCIQTFNIIFLVLPKITPSSNFNLAHHRNDTPPHHTGHFGNDHSCRFFARQTKEANWCLQTAPHNSGDERRAIIAILFGKDWALGTSGNFWGQTLSSPACEDIVDVGNAHFYVLLICFTILNNAIFYVWKSAKRHANVAWNNGLYP